MIITFRKACKQKKPFKFVDDKFDDGIYKVECGELMQWCGEGCCNDWTYAFDDITWIINCANRKVEILEKFENNQTNS